MPTKTLLMILCCMLTTWIAYGFQAPLMQMGQKAIGPWRAIFCAALGWAVVGTIAGYFGNRIQSHPNPLGSSGITASTLAGMVSCIGTLSLIVAFRVATQSGNSLGSTWISPTVTAVLPIFYVVTSYLLLQKPAGGYAAYFNPWYLGGMVVAIIGAVMMMLNRPST